MKPSLLTSLFLFIAVSSLRIASGFVAPTNRYGYDYRGNGAATLQPSSTLSELQSSRSVMDSSAEALIVTATSDLVNLELPKKKNNANQALMEVEERLMAFEVGIGRIAMVAAVIFFGVEITSDMSIPQQLASLGIMS